MTDLSAAIAALRAERDANASIGHEPVSWFLVDAALAAIDTAQGEARQKVKNTLTDYLDHYPHPELLDAIMAQFVTAAPPAALTVLQDLSERFSAMHANGDAWITSVAAAKMAQAAATQAQQPAAAVPAEPVAWVWQGNIDGLKAGNRFEKALLWNRPTGQAGFALYAAPPAALAVPATMADGWRHDICATLNRVMPSWIAAGKTPIEAACNAIEALAAVACEAHGKPAALAERKGE